VLGTKSLILSYLQLNFKNIETLKQLLV